MLAKIHLSNKKNPLWLSDVIMRSELHLDFSIIL